MERWNYSGLPPVDRYNAVVDTANELLAACKRAEFAFRVPAGTRPFDEVRALQMLREAIDKAEATSHEQ